jgi:hypothetical protein
MLLDQITALKRKRYELLRLLYVKTNADPSQYVEDTELQQEVAITRQQFVPIIMELASNGFVEMTHQSAAITFPGIHEVERIESDHDRGTDYFPAINVMYVEQVSHSSIQQGTYHSTQSTHLDINDTQRLAEFVQRLGDTVSKLNLNSDDEKQTKAEIATVQAQASSARPSRTIIRESLISLRRILEGAAGGAAGAQANDWLRELLQLAQHFK